MLQPPAPQDACPCGTDKTFSQCCAPLLTGERRAPTASALMRSRYTAFVTGAFDYLIATHAPEMRSPDDKTHLTEQFADIEWLGLELHGTKKGKRSDTLGWVEFTARYRNADGEGALHEVSRFRKVQGRWYYVNGEIS